MVSTVYELGRERHAVAAELFSGITFDEAQIGAVLEGRQEGRIFVDDPVRPRAALLCRTYGFYPAGDTDAAAFRAFIADAPEEAGEFDRLFGYMVDSAWRDALLHDQGGDLVLIDRLAFHFPEEAEPPVISPPDHVTIRTIDIQLARRIDEEMHQDIGSFWGGYERFAAQGFGFCAMIGNTVVSVAYAVAVSRNTANIGVRTVDAYRRQGLATLTSAAFIGECRRRGLTATWDCDATNTRSIATARTLGFQEDPPFWQLSPASGVLKVRSLGTWQAETSDDAVASVVYRRGRHADR